MPTAFLAMTPERLSAPRNMTQWAGANGTASAKKDSQGARRAGGLRAAHAREANGALDRER